MAVAAVFVGAVSVSSLDQPFCAIPAGVCAVFLTIGALTGWCPTQLLARRDPGGTLPNALGYDEALQPIDLDSRPVKEHS